ncbi:MAG: redoxin domain-containing protein, partial [Bryobacteraceae bacterium]
MVQLQSDLAKIQANGAQLVAVSSDPPEILKRFVAKKSITYPLLSDTGSKTIDAYGIRNKEATGRTSWIPYPGIYVIGTDGVIRAKLFLEGYQE